MIETGGAMLPQVEFAQRQRIGDRKAAFKRRGMSRAGQRETAQQNSN